MKRIKGAMRNVFTKTKSIAVSPAAAATIIAVCTVVGSIPVPGVQTVCTGISEFIKMMEGAHSNDEQWTALLDVMQRYAKRLEKFAGSVSQNQPDNYLVDSTDKVAVDAREAIEEFTKQITEAKNKIEAKRNEGKLKKFLGASAIKDEIRECRQALADALEDFNGRVHMIIVMSTVKPVEATIDPDPYNIPGAKPIKNGDFRILHDIDYPPPIYASGVETFWQNLRSVNVGKEQNLVAKIYVTKSSKERFKKDLEFFAENMGPRIARLFRYNAESRHPYMIFSLTSVRPLLSHLLDLSRKDRQRYLIEGWKLFRDLYTAGKFLCDQADDYRLQYYRIEASIRDAAVGSDGQLVLAPPCDVRVARVGEMQTPTEWIIKEQWSKGKIGGKYEQYIRAIRPFTFAVAQDTEKFLYTDINRFTSPSQVSGALQRLWPDLKDPSRVTRCGNAAFSYRVTAGDVGALEVGDDGEIRFRYLTNIADVFGGVKFWPPSKLRTEYPNIYRETCYDTIDEPDRPYWKLWVFWVYTLDEQKVNAAELARQFKIIGERYGVPPTSLAMTRNANYRLQSSSCGPMREMLQTGKPIHCYVSFDPDTQLFQSARWSFHPHPPSEEEAAAEVNVLEAFKCPELWAHPRPWTDINYWQLEDEDFEFFSKISGDNEETARIEVLEEPSGSSSLKT